MNNKKNASPREKQENTKIEDQFDDIEVNDLMPEDDGEEQPVDAEMSETQQLMQQLNTTKEQLEKEKKEYLFLMAEFDNFRKRTLREKSEILRNASESAMKGLLPIVDDFERGLEAIKVSSDAEVVKEGMTLIYNKLIKYLEQNGVKPMDTNGKPFDPDLHEAIAMVPAEDPEQKGKIIDTVSRGYTINDKVLRHAKVAVAQ